MDDSFRRLPTVSIKLNLSLLPTNASLLFFPLNHPPAFENKILRSYHHPEAMTASTWPDGNASLISYMKASRFRSQERRWSCRSMVAALLGASTRDTERRTTTTTRAWELRRRRHLRWSGPVRALLLRKGGENFAMTRSSCSISSRSRSPLSDFILMKVGVEIVQLNCCCYICRALKALDII